MADDHSRRKVAGNKLNKRIELVSPMLQITALATVSLEVTQGEPRSRSAYASLPRLFLHTLHTELVHLQSFDVESS